MDLHSTAAMGLRGKIASLVEQELSARRIAISRELATIPPPVPACDVDFNRLLEDRGRVGDDLQTLKRLIADGAADTAIVDFCRESDSVSAGLKQQIEALYERS